MHIKIQGGGSGEYSNTGTSYGVVAYLRHEDKELLEQDKKVEPFFSHYSDFVAPSQVVDLLDANKAKLGRNDSKFFVLTISPSQDEILAMGADAEEQARVFKEYINTRVMEHYATGFGKNLEAKDILYFGKIHHARGDKVDEQMHAHIVVSRKDKSNKIKLSPQTNHRSTQKGVVKGGFDRTSFFQQSEASFDKHFQYDRQFTDTFEYKNTMKNGTIPEKIAIEVEMHRNNLLQEENSKAAPLNITKEHKATLLEKLEIYVLQTIAMDIRTRGVEVDTETIGKYIEEYSPKKELGVDNSSNALDLITNDNRQEFESSIFTKANLLFEMIESSMNIPLSKEHEEEEEKAKKRKRGKGMGR